MGNEYTNVSSEAGVHQSSNASFVYSLTALHFSAHHID
jgi:hypothetical protein